MAIDDHETVAALDAARAVFQSGVVLQGGRVIDMAGDSVLAVFDTAAGAVRAARDIQAELARRTETLPADRRLQFRVGVHLGDVIEKPDGSVYGDGVNVASRLQALAQPGSIVVSQAIQSSIGGRARAGFVDLGEHSVKNIAQPVRAYSCSVASSKGDASPAGGDATAAGPVSSPTLAEGRRRAAKLVIVALLVVFALVAGGFAVQRFNTAADPAPYSAADRRMTFAVLPTDAPNGDPVAERLARSIGETVQTEAEARSLWSRVLPQGLVLQAIAKPSSLRQVGAALDVHYLLRPRVSRATTGYDAALALVDAQTERVIDTFPLQVAGGPEPKAIASILEDAVSIATYRALRDEVARARSKPDARLDVRDLGMRAYSDWGERDKNAPEAYARAQRNIERALALAPDDLLALRVAAEMNLCECARAWAGERRQEMLNVGSRALDRYLVLSPGANYPLFLRSRLLFEQRHFDAALAVADDILRRAPNEGPALRIRASALYMLHRLPEALDATQAALSHSALGDAEDADMNSLAMQIRYAMGDDAATIRHATQALSKLPSRGFEEPSDAQILLYLAAAHARSGNKVRAKKALDEFFTAVPGVRNTAQFQAWLGKIDETVDPELLVGLRLAGVSD